MAHTRASSSTTDNVRMGPLAVFTLITVICLSILAVLSLATAHATLSLSQRRAQATTQVYANETAAQTFVAILDEQLAAGTAPNEALEAARMAALDTAQGKSEAGPLAVSAQRQGNTYSATFDCGNGRTLELQLSFDNDGTYHIDTWRMTTVYHDEPTIGNLWGSL